MFCLANFAFTLPNPRNVLPSNIYMKFPVLIHMSEILTSKGKKINEHLDKSKIERSDNIS